MVVAWLAGCASPAYYWQAARGQWQLSHAGQPVSALLADPQTDAELRAQLQTARDVVAFAGETLMLPADGAYQRYVRTGRDAVTWTVIATPEFSLAPETWCHLVAGCVAYRGYFDEDAARRFAAGQSRRGRDAAVFPVPAYSTLGWLDDPLLDTMLRGDPLTLAATVIHELAHRRLYVSGDAAFSERYARFVEEAGIEAWLAGLPPAEAERLRGQWRRRLAQREAATAALVDARRSLERIYAAPDPPDAMQARKRAVFDALVRELDAVAPPAEAWVSANPNNAHVAMAGLYEAAGCPFEMLFETAGGDWQRFHALVEERAALDDAARAKWLEAPCPATHR